MLKIQVIGQEKVQARLTDSAKRGTNGVVVVGFATNYAIYVHENLEANHPVGQAKFLEQPARANRTRYNGIIAGNLRAGKTLTVGMYEAALDLQRDAQKLVPVDTGNLKNSAFTKIERSS